MIYLLLADGFEEVEALTPLDLLRRAGKEILTVSIGSDRAVTGAHGITVLADITAEQLSHPSDEMLILPGGMPGTKNLDASPITDRLIEETLSNGGHLAAICAAPLIQGKRGLLKGKRATCYPGFEKELVGATVVSAYAVTDGNVTTATGAGAAIPFARELIRVLCGDAVANDLLRAFRYTDVIPVRCEEPELDEYFEQAVEIAIELGKVSTSLLQRRLGLGFGKAARLIDQMCEKGIVSPPNGAKPREVLIRAEDYKKTAYTAKETCSDRKKGTKDIASEDVCLENATAPLSDDELFDKAMALALEHGRISVSLLQRCLGIGFGKSARIIDRMCELGFVSTPNGQKPREILISAEEYKAFCAKRG